MARSGHAWMCRLLFVVLCFVAGVAGAHAVAKTLGDDATIEFPATPVADASQTGFGLTMPVGEPSPTGIYGAAKIDTPLWVHFMFRLMPDVSPDMFADKLTQALGNEPGFKLIQSQATEIDGYPGVTFEMEVTPSLGARKRGPNRVFPGLAAFGNSSEPVHVQGLLILIKGNFYAVAAGSIESSPEFENGAEHFLGSFKPTDVHVRGDFEREAGRVLAIVLSMFLIVLTAVTVTIVLVVKRVKRRRENM
jgi:hypothetical protein